MKIQCKARRRARLETVPGNDAKIKRYGSNEILKTRRFVGERASRRINEIIRFAKFAKTKFNETKIYLHAPRRVNDGVFFFFLVCSVTRCVERSRVFVRLLPAGAFARRVSPACLRLDSAAR